MKCASVQPELFSLIRAEDAPVEVAHHVEHCISCTEEMGSLKDVVTAIEAAGVIRPPEHLRAAVLERALEESVGTELRLAVPALPPVALKERVMAATKAQPVRLAPRRKTNVRELIFAAAAIIALVFATFSYVQRDEEGGSGGEIPRGHDMQTVALSGEVGAKGTLTHYRHDNYRLSLSVEGYEVTPPDFQYAVWLRGPEGDVPLGGFRIKRPDDFVVPYAIAVDPVEYPRLVVTLEPIDGDERLTGDVVSEGRLDPAKVYHGDYQD